MTSGFDKVLGRLADQDLITPYFEAAVLADNWPLSYDIKVDSSPYYGLDADGRPDGFFHPSSHPMLGERELYYRFHPAFRDKLTLEPNTVEKQLAFAVGSAIHAVVQTQMQMAKLVTPEDIEVEYVNEEHNVRGRIDWLAHHPNGTRLLVELKTCNQRKFANQTEPDPSWVAQVNLGLDSQDLDLGILLMLEVGYPYRLTEWRIRRNRELLDNLYAKFDRVREAIARNEPPRHCCAPDSTTMKACPARFHCWLKDHRGERNLAP